MDNFFPHMTVYLGLVAGAFAISFLLIVFLDFKPQGRGDVQALILFSAAACSSCRAYIGSSDV